MKVEFIDISDIDQEQQSYEIEESDRRVDRPTRSYGQIIEDLDQDFYVPLLIRYLLALEMVRVAQNAVAQGLGDAQTYTDALVHSATVLKQPGFNEAFKNRALEKISQADLSEYGIRYITVSDI